MGNGEVKTVIAEDIEIVGSVKCASSIQIDGKLNGDLSCSGNAVIGVSASIKGNLAVDSVSLLGQINGNIVAKDRIELKSSAKLTGDIRAKRLTVEDGCSFVGKSEVNASGTAMKPSSESKAASDDALDLDDDDDDEPAARNTRGGKSSGIFGKK